MNKLGSVFSRYAQRFASFKRTNPRKIGLMASLFFKENFRRQGFLDSSIIKWQPRKRKRTNPILIDTGRMKRGIRATKTTFREIVITSDAAYSSFHNEGTDRLPKRQFIGQSEVLKQEIKKVIIQDLKKVFR